MRATMLGNKQADLERALKDLTNPFARGGHQRPVSDAEVQRVQAKLDGTKDRRARANAHLDTLGRAHAPLSTVLEKSDRFSWAGRTQSSTAHCRRQRHDETPAATVTRLRAEIDNLKRDLDKIAKAPVPVQQALDRARRTNQQARREWSGLMSTRCLAGISGSSTCNGRRPTSGSICLATLGPMAKATYPQAMMGFAGGDRPDARGADRVLFHDTRSACHRPDQEARQREKRPEREQLAARRTELAAELLLAERCEVAHLEQAEAEGAMIPLRPDCDISALLWLA